MEEIADRHSGDLGGTLRPMADSRRPILGIRISPNHAGLASTQHTAWMLVNILARAVGVVDRIVIDCDSNTSITGRVVPLAPNSHSIADALIIGARAIGGVQCVLGVVDGSATITIEVGPGAAVENGFRACGSGWWGGISREELAIVDSPLPFGPYAAACLASARVFFESRALRVPPFQPAGYSMWRLQATSAPSAQEGWGAVPHGLAALNIGLAGCGAVGTSWLHAIWATPDLRGEVLVADPDPEGITATNLNRYPLFGRADLGSAKADAARRSTQTMNVHITPLKERIEVAAPRPTFIVSAVDTNTSRQAIQSQYPGRLLQASTHGVRAEVLRCDPTSEGACIRCFGDPESDLPDVEARKRFLAMPRDDQESLAGKMNLSIDDATTWAIEGECGNAVDELLQHLRTSATGPPSFAVGFVSVMAGTMLAAQTIRELADLAEPFDGSRCRAAVTLVDPAAVTNRVSAFHRDPACPLCIPGSIAKGIWKDRYDQYSHLLDVGGTDGSL